MKHKITFIILNTIFIAILWYIISIGLVYSNFSLLNNIALISMLLILFFEFGGECLFTTIYSYKTKSRLSLNFFIFIILSNIIIFKLIVPKINFIFICLIIINQVFGFSLAKILLKKKKGS